jgi:glycosidase
LYGDRFAIFAVLAATLPGMPLILGGQESKLDKKIAFFEKDAISWKSFTNAPLYQKLLRLKARHPALRNGAEGGAIELVATGNNNVFAFKRTKGRDSVFVAVNFSNDTIYVPRVRRAIAPWGFQIVE